MHVALSPNSQPAVHEPEVGPNASPALHVFVASHQPHPDDSAHESHEVRDAQVAVAMRLLRIAFLAARFCKQMLLLPPPAPVDESEPVDWSPPVESVFGFSPAPVDSFCVLSSPPVDESICVGSVDPAEDCSAAPSDGPVEEERTEEESPLDESAGDEEEPPLEETDEEGVLPVDDREDGIPPVDDCVGCSAAVDDCA